MSRSRTASRSLLQAARASADGSPLFLCDLRIVKHQVNRWHELMPSVEPFYAVKCNNDPEIVRVLAKEGISFDCASAAEMRQVIETISDLPPTGHEAANRIVYANPVKHVAHVRSGRRMGVRLTTFDNVNELEKLARLAPGMKLLLRLATDDRKSVCRFSEKFGADEAAVPGLLRAAAALGLDVVGVSFHVGSGCYDAATYGDALRRARLAFDVAASMGRPMEVLDVGGGFPGSLHGSLTGAGDRTREMSRDDPGVYMPLNGSLSGGAVVDGMGDIISTGSMMGGLSGDSSADPAAARLGHTLASVVTQAAREAAMEASGRTEEDGQGEGGDDDGFDPDHADLSGGSLGDPRLGAYAGGDTFREIARALRHYLRLYFPKHEAARGSRWNDILGRPVAGPYRRSKRSRSTVTAMPPMVLAEPGRFFAEASHTLMLTVSGRREVDAQMFREAGITGRDPRARVYVTDGLYGSLNSVLYDHACVAPAAVSAAALGLAGRHWDSEGVDAALPGADPVCAIGDADSEVELAAAFLMPAVTAADMAGQAVSEEEIDTLMNETRAAAPVLPLPEDLAAEATLTGSTALAAAAQVLRPGDEDSESDSSSESESGEGRTISHEEALSDVHDATMATRRALGAALEAWASSREGSGADDAVPAWYCPPSEWAERQHVSLWGPTCDGFDLIASDILLPSTLAVGDALLFDSAGAYTKAAGTSFNGFAMPKTAYISEDLEWDYEAAVPEVDGVDGDAGGRS